MHQSHKKKLAKPAFEILTKKAIVPQKDEIITNTRSRSAKLRVGRRTNAPYSDFSEEGFFNNFQFGGKF